MEEDENFIVCCRVGKALKPLIAGAVKEKCYICGEDCWVSPGTLKSIELGVYKGEITCLNCINDKMRSSK